MAIKRKAKGKLKMDKELKSARTRTRPLRAIKAAVEAEKKVPYFGGQELAVEKAKFSHPQPAPARRCLPDELPGHYGISRMVLLARDASWLYTWWEVGPGIFEELKRRLGEEFYKSKRVVRVYDVTGIDFNGANAVGFFDIQINDYAENWYINAAPARSWCVELGLLLADGRFIMILRSNIVATPLDGPSGITDEEWMVPQELFARLYGMGLGAGRASPGKGWQARVGWSSVSSRMGSGFISSPVKRVVK